MNESIDTDRTIDTLQSILASFAKDRDWDKFHTPRNLVLALSGEIGELASLFQWVSDDATRPWLASEENRSSASDEIADVFVYLLYLSKSLNIDLFDAVVRKIEKNSVRYGVEQSFGSSAKAPSQPLLGGSEPNG